MCLVHVLPPSPAPRQATLVHGTHSLPASFTEAVIAPVTLVHGLAPQHAGCLVAHVCTHTWPRWRQCARCGAPTVTRVTLSFSHRGVLEVLDPQTAGGFGPTPGVGAIVRRVYPGRLTLDHLSASFPLRWRSTPCHCRRRMKRTAWAGIPSQGATQSYCFIRRERAAQTTYSCSRRG